MKSETPPWRVYRRPAGDYAVQRFSAGRTVRYSLHSTLAKAMQDAAFANAAEQAVAD